jgi:predicted Zn-dependent protease
MMNFFRRLLARPIFLSLGVCLVVLCLGQSGRAIDLPPLSPHTIPPSLEQLQNLGQNPDDNYADRLQPTPVGALIWSRFPVSVGLDLTLSDQPRAEAWTKAVAQAIADWQPYIPMELASPDKTADKTPDITIRRRTVPIQPKGGKPGPIRFAETRFEFYTEDNILRHRMVITLSPNQADLSMLSAARHELGHALGLWGHSDRPTDIMYDRQVANPPKISDRDLATMQKIYAQPTRLDWPLPKTP